ncbi:ABC transporter permease [Stappia sp. ES.058]|uniref:ABC transporter permease n=1 Tax=Stappia sp. ES.058 TaxID=1881061 RepID=UPI00087DA2F1|nr:ABC transporter permease subunit [Stappia sp. ES.058]SDT88556.1 putative thiamine transport system permease protein [Stappia sp. ES.058]
MLKAAPFVTLALMLGPVIAGLAGTLLPAFGFVPPLGGTTVSLDPARALLSQPGLATSVLLSLFTGLAATLGAFTLVMLFTAAFEGTRMFRGVRLLLSPLLSVPHAAAAFGLAFLIAPSGWAMRLVSPWASGMTRPPDVLVIGDPAGLAMTFGLMAKEIPFLFLMVLAALPQTKSPAARRIATGLGYAPVTGWLKVVLPRVYPQIRLPVFAVLAYATSVVDVALILGPTTPAPLAVRLVAWMNDPDLSFRFMASAGALLQLVISLSAIALWIAGEQLAKVAGRRWIAAGRRTLADRSLAVLAAAAMVTLVGALLCGLCVLGLWSFAGPWRFPDALPAHLSLQNWMLHLGGVLEAVGVTLAVALPVTALAVVLALACLEGETRRGRALRHRTLPLLYVPLIVPQIAFLFGLQVLFLVCGLHDTLGAVALAHLVFVLPYVFLALSDPWRAADPRYGHIATALGAAPDRVFWRVRLPLALRATATAAALGIAVSVAQYLPTLLIGGGRIASVTTEAVALAAGGNRRLIAIYALLQMALPFLAFALAALVPGVAFRARRDLQPSI